jgi:hemolysin III
MSKHFREPVNGFTHMGAAIAAVIGLGLLLYLSRTSLILMTVLLVYGLSLIMMFTASSIYHLVKGGPTVMQRLRKFDHTAIYLLIAGTYTPICLYYFQGVWRWGILATIWALALAGIIVKLFVINAPRWVTAGIYLVMGWLAAIGFRQIITNMPAGAITWLVAGGLFFSIGAVVYITKKPNFFPRVFGFHEIWHIFVILGCLAHFILIAYFIAPSPAPIF